MNGLSNQLSNAVYQQTYVAENLLNGLTADGRKQDIFDIGELRRLFNERLIEISKRNPMITHLYKQARSMEAKRGSLYFESYKAGREIIRYA